MRFVKKTIFWAYFITLFWGFFKVGVDISVLTENDSEDLIVEGNDVLVINNTLYIQKGNVIIRENGILVIRNSRFIMEQSLHERYKVILYNNAKLRIENSEIDSVVHYPLIVSFNSSQVYVINSTFIFEHSNVIKAYGESKVSLENVRAVGYLEINLYDFSNISVKNSELYFVATYGNSTALVINSLIKHDIWCRDSSRLVLYNSTISAEGIAGFLIAEDSSNILISNFSRIEGSLTAKDLSRISIDNAYVRWLQLSKSSNVKVTNNSTINGLSISFSGGQTIISNLKPGYIFKNKIYEHRTGLNFTVITSKIININLKIGGSSFIFIKDSQISTISLASYSSAVIYNSQIDIIYCSMHSFVLIWNSRITYPVQGDHKAMVLYFSTVDISVFNLIITAFIAISIVYVITVIIFLKRHKHNLPSLHTDQTTLMNEK